MSNKRHTILDVFDEDSKGSRRDRRERSRGAARRQESESRHESRHESRRGARSGRGGVRGSGRREQLRAEDGSYTMAEAVVPGSSAASSGHSYSATSAEESRTGSAPVDAVREGVAVSASPETGSGSSHSRARRGQGPAGTAEQVRDWLGAEQRSTRGALLAGAGAALLLIWGSYQLGANTSPPVEAQERASLAGPGENRSEEPGGREMILDNQRSALNPRPAVNTGGSERPASSARGEGAPPAPPKTQEWSESGFFVLTRKIASPNALEATDAVKRHLEQQGFGKVDWIDDRNGHYRVGVRYPKGADQEERRALFERVRALPKLDNKVVKMSFGGIALTVYTR